MTRLKVVNTLTNSTYYLNNVDVSCAKLHSYIGETDKKRKILHTPLAHLEYSIENQHEDIVTKLNILYKAPISNDKEYFPKNTGIIISDMFTDPEQAMGPLPTYTPYRIDCNNITIDETTYWCPPVIKRSTSSSGSIQSSRVSSFSYIHNTLLSSVYTNDISFLKFMIYDNTNEFNVSQKQIFQIYPGDAMSSLCLPKQFMCCPDGQYCSSGAIGACINNQYFNAKKTPDSCLQDCSWNNNNMGTACKNFNFFIHSIKKNHTTHGTKGVNNNELIIKSWNYNPKSNMSNRGIMYNSNMNIWVEQKPNPKSLWGWTDVSNLSSNENIPLLAFGVTVPDITTISGNDILTIKKLYTELSNNLEPSFNEYRRNNKINGNPIPLMPYHIGLNRACLTQPDCSNPFFDLSLILHLKS